MPYFGGRLGFVARSRRKGRLKTIGFCEVKTQQNSLECLTAFSAAKTAEEGTAGDFSGGKFIPEFIPNILST
ncbi:MAG: hypothetical protein Q4D82_05465 [Neisseria sp.]|nr:hypothetical protein [Neisseria sp.]